MGCEGSKQTSPVIQSHTLINQQQEIIQQLQIQNQQLMMVLGSVAKQLEFTKDDKKVVEIEGKRYDIKEKLGQGGFGTVFKAECNGKTYAIKEIKVTEDNESSILAELKFIKLLREQFSGASLPVIQIFGVEIVDDDRLFYVMEMALMSLEDFYEKICGTPEASGIGLVFFFFILRALLFLESIGCTHRDIKPDNFVLVEDNSFGTKFNIKLIDFGTVREMDKTLLLTSGYAGTLAFMAPEAFKGVVSTKLDVWSLGIMLYRLIYNNEYPDYVQDQRSIMIFAANDDEVNFPRCKPEFSDLLQLAKLSLVKDYNKRMCASDLYKFTYPKYNEICKQIIRDPYINNSKLANLRTGFSQINRKPNNIKNNLNPGDKKCFICNEKLPNGHKYNRCDKCFDTRCLICYKVLPNNYAHRRCEQCFKTKCLDCQSDLPKGHPYRRCNSCFAKSRK